MSDALLVVSHEATRTGAPRVLLEVLEAIRPMLAVPIAVRLEAEGPLAPDLRSCSAVDPIHTNPIAILVNGAQAAATVLDYPHGVPSILYVHEEGEALDLLPAADRIAMREGYDIVACVSDQGRRDLLELGVDASSVRLLPPPIPRLRAGRESGSVDPSRHDEPLVIGCGAAAWRKGPDLFIEVARRVNEVRPTCFAWAGRRPRAYARVLDNDTAASGLSERLHWLGELAELEPLYRCADLLLMTSREDPQPLVPLEAALSRTATAGFSVGGLADLSGVGAAATVPYPDTATLAGVVVELLEDDTRRAQLIEQAAMLASLRTAEQTASRLMDDLRSIAPEAAR